jgi:ligand-binding SRPBCC domain-containing protein
MVWVAVGVDNIKEFQLKFIDYCQDFPFIPAWINDHSFASSVTGKYVTKNFVISQ